MVGASRSRSLGWARGARAEARGADGRNPAARLVCLLLATTTLQGAMPAKAQSPDAGMVNPTTLQEDLRNVESAFARSMAERNLEAFVSFLAEETIFLGQKGTLRGKAAVTAAWSRYFEGDVAPFSWTPEQVEVLDSGTLGLTSGPVRDPAGNTIGTFNSVWRREGSGWRIVFDKGCPPCS